MKPVALVMNVFYTGLGIARSLGDKSIPVIGLSAHRRIYGNYTRYAKTLFCPDSRHEPEALAEFLVRLGRGLHPRGVLFPTRDDDLMFLDRFRKDLEPYFSLVIPDSLVLKASLDKWSTTEWARRAGVPAPGAWMVENPEDLERAGRGVRYPCVLKPLSAHLWRQGNNWDLVGARKAVAIHSFEELCAEYKSVARADSRALVQEMVPGADDCLLIAACYMDRKCRWTAGFNTQKILQIPEGFGTGCIVQSVERPELFERTKRLLETMRFSGVAEVEYKWDAAEREYKLIEINPRPWDQHRLGNAAGVDLIYLAYCDHAGLPIPQLGEPQSGHKWVAEDALVTATLRSLKNGGGIGRFWRLARGRRIYAIWSVKDPMPAIAYFFGAFFPGILRDACKSLWQALRDRIAGTSSSSGKELAYETQVQKSQRLG
jgi:predicted ATP-grasp superfamily ATP-dependent carboligase